LDAGVDEERVRQRHAELVAAVAQATDEVRRPLDEQLMAVDVRVVGAGEHGRAARMVRVAVRVDDGAHRRGKESPERGPHLARLHRVAARIDDDRPAVALEQGHVAGRVPNGHVHPVGHPNHLLAELMGLRAQFLAPGKCLGRRSRAEGHQHHDRERRRIRHREVHDDHARHRRSPLGLSGNA
jgi:hypothetical protein